MQVLPRCRLALARHPSIYWLAVTAVALALAAPIGIQQTRLRAQQRAWGHTTTVWVAVADADAGQPLRVQQREYPAAMVPAAAITVMPAGATAVHAVADGEMLVETDLATSGPGGLVPPGYVALAVPTAPGPHLGVGAPVRLYSNGNHLADGTIVATDDEQVVVAVPSAGAPSIAMAITDGVIVLALVGPAR